MMHIKHTDSGCTCASTPANKFLRILTSEREALLNGEISKLEALSAQKKDILQKDLKQSELRVFLTHFAEELRRNQRLLKSAISGIHDVKSRVHLYEPLVDGMDIYKPSGEKVQIAAENKSRIAMRV